MSNAQAAHRITPPLAESLKLTRFIFQTVGKASWSETAEHPEMFGSDARTLINDFIQFCRDQKQEGAALVLETFRDFVRRSGDSKPSELARRDVKGSRRQHILKFPQLVALIDTTWRAIEAERNYALMDDKPSAANAVSLWRTALADPLFRRTPFSWRLDAFNAAGNSFLTNYQLYSQQADLDTGLGCYREAIEASPTGWPNLHKYFYNSARAFFAYYSSSGALQDIERSVQFCERAIESAPSSSPNMPMYLSFAGIVLGTRYLSTGQIEDLDRAIETQQLGISRLPPESLELTVYLNQLGSSYRKRFNQSGEIKDIQLAVSLQEQSIERSDDDVGEGLAARLTNLGNSLLDLYGATGDSEDLNRAVAALEHAVALTDTDSLLRASRLNNLGNGLRSRYFHKREIADLVRSIENYREAIELSSGSSPDLPSRLYNLANALTTLSNYSNKQEDVNEAIQNYRGAAKRGLDVAREWSLSAALNWGEWASERKSWVEAVEAYRYGMAAIDQLFHNQLLRTNKETWLRKAQRLPSQAAYALAQSSDLEGAVTALEGGRTRLLSDSLERARANLGRLAEIGHEDLYKRYRRAARRLTVLEAAELGQRKALAVSDLSAELQSVRAELDLAIAAIQQIPEYRDFLSPPNFDQIHSTLTRPADDKRQTVGVYLLATPAGGLSLIVHSAGVQAVWLEFAESDLIDLLVQGTDNSANGYLSAQFDATSFPDVLDTILSVVGERLMGPVARALRKIIAESPATDGPPRIVLIPTGLLSLLPLHAARYQVEGRSVAAIDEFVLTYATSARVLASSQEAAKARRRAKPRLLAFGNPLPLPKNLQPLAFAEAEVREVARFFDSRAELLPATGASLIQVTGRLGRADYLHFSCHGLFDSQEPMQSGLILSNNDRLTLGDLLATPPLDRARLAVLSACQTAITDFNELPEEAVGLPSGFLQAGVPGVIGSLWPVNDLSTAVLMKEFYRLHLSEGLGIGSALRRAQQWLRDGTEEQMKLADYWQQEYESSGRSDANAFRLMRIYRANPQLRPFEHPYYWAAFTCNGI